MLTVSTSTEWAIRRFEMHSSVNLGISRYEYHKPERNTLT